jgi:glycine/D-amino acid oxidase-like deaminating enzyme
VRGIEFKQMANGRIVGTDAPLPPDIPAHREIRDHAVDFPDDGVRSLHGRRILHQIATYLPAARAAIFVYAAVTHSGVTLAPILGQHVSREILDDQLIDSLAPYRPTRFAR